MDLKEKVKALPHSPGVYQMKDSQGSIIYVGKSKNLKSRVSSYFINSNSHSPKVINLVKNLKDFDYIVTDTEFEAFLLECKLIRNIKPHYNKLMKNPMSYSFICINMEDGYPNFKITNVMDENSGSLYWGPFTRKNSIEKGLNALKEFCKIPCSTITKKNSSCLNYSMGLCIGACLGEPSRVEYISILNKIINLLNGKDNYILESIILEMKNCADRFDFEGAAKYRDYIGVINSLINKARVIEFAEECPNIALLEVLEENLLKFFLIKGNKILFSEKYFMKEFDLEELKNTLINIILFNLKEPNVPTTIGKDEIDESQIIYSYLRNNSFNSKFSILPQDWINAKDITLLRQVLDILFC